MRTSLWKLKRSLNNLAFRMSFIRLAPGSSRPLLPIAEFLIVGFTVFVLAGGLFVLTQGGQGLLNVQSGYSFVYPGDINNQTTQEAVFTTLIYAMGILGLYMMFMSTRYAYRPKRAYGPIFQGFFYTPDKNHVWHYPSSFHNAHRFSGCLGHEQLMYGETQVHYDIRRV